MPWEAWYFGRGGKPGQPSPFKWTFHFSFGGAQFAGSYISAWNQIPTNKKVGAMFPNDADGNAVRAFLPDALRQAGFTVVDPGPFEDGTTDYSTQITIFKKEQCEIISALVLPPDFATFWRQAAQQGLTKIVKIAQPAKAGGSPTEINALGPIGVNLCVAALKSTTDPLDKAALAKSISTLKTITTVGEIDFNSGPMPHVIATTRFVGTQYQKTKPGSKFNVEQLVIENSEDPNVPIGGKLIPYNTGGVNTGRESGKLGTE